VAARKTVGRTYARSATQSVGKGLDPQVARALLHMSIPVYPPRIRGLEKMSYVFFLAFFGRGRDVGIMDEGKWR
jgi:hypothetical protein